MDVAIGLLAVGAIGGFITALVTIFVPKISPSPPDLRRLGRSGVRRHHGFG